MSESKDRTTRQARVDLTSQDIRTGTLRLPNRLQGLLDTGVVAARDTVTDATHELLFSAPRDIGGLTGFFGTHELKPNDAVDFVFSSEMITIAPYYRQRRRQIREADDPARVADDAAKAAPSHDTDQPSSAEPRSADAAAESTDALLPPEGPRTRHTGAPSHPLPAADADMSASRDLPSGSASTEATSTPDPRAAKPHQPSATEEDDPFLAFDSYEGQPDDDDLDYPADDLRLAADDAPGAHDGGEPSVSLGGAPAGERVPEEEPPEEPTDRTAYHHVGRRSFGKPTAGRFRPVPPRVVTDSQAAGGRTTELAPEPSHARAYPGHSPQQPLWESIDRSPASLLKGYLAQPDLPSVIQASTLATELDMQPVDVDAILAELSLAPDSRISAIRPDFYLVKRTNR